MAHLKTKAQFDNLNEFEKRDVATLIHDAHESFIWVAIELRNPPKGLDMSRVYGAQFSSSHNMSEYVRVGSSIAKNSVEITKVKSWLV